MARTSWKDADDQLSPHTMLKRDGRQWVVHVITTMIIIAFLASVVGGLSFKYWLNAKREIELKKLENAKDAEREKTIRESYATIENIVQKKAEPFVNVLEVNAPKIAKAAHGATEVDVGKRHYDRSEIEELNKRAPRSKAKSETRSMSLRICGYSHDSRGRFKVKATDVDTGENFEAFLAPPGMFEEQQEFSVPRTAGEISKADDAQSIIEAEVLFTETKTKVERYILSWFDPNDDDNSETQ